MNAVAELEAGGDLPWERVLAMLLPVETPLPARPLLCGGDWGHHMPPSTPIGGEAVWGRGAVDGAVECSPMQAVAGHGTQAGVTPWELVALPT